MGQASSRSAAVLLRHGGGGGGGGAVAAEVGGAVREYAVREASGGAGVEKRERKLEVRRREEEKEEVEDERDAAARETAVKMRRLFGSIVEVKPEASSAGDASQSTASLSSSVPSSLSMTGARNIMRERKRLNARDTRGRVDAAQLRSLFQERRAHQTGRGAHAVLDDAFVHRMAEKHGLRADQVENLCRYTSTVKVLEAPEGGEVARIGVWDEESMSSERLRTLMRQRGIKVRVSSVYTYMSGVSSDCRPACNSRMHT